MRNRRTMVGALCIILAMMLGAFAGLVYARPGGVGVSPDVGTRGEDRRLVSASSEQGQLLDASVAEQVTQVAPLTAASESVTIQSADGTLTARLLTSEEQRSAAVKGLSNGDLGTSDVRTADAQTGAGTRAWPPGTVDAGGPYGGPSTFEGGPAIMFTATANDPAIIFFRWDFNNDGVFDFPDQTGGGALGKWTTDTSVSKQFNDNYFGQVVVQGWDGVSTTVTFNSGDNGLTSLSIQYLIGYGNYVFAERFQAKANLVVTALKRYVYAYTLYQMGIWDASTGTLLGQCTPSAITYFSWNNICTLPTPVSLVIAKEYLIGYRTTSYGNLVSAISDTSKVHWVGLYYCSGTTLCYPSTSFSPSYTLMMDFNWQETVIIPDTAQDSAQLQVVNVAPIVSNVVTTPSPVLEGSPADFTVQFSDPGLDDTWEYRWTFHDGTTSGWQPIRKFDGGAKVLLLHSWSGSISGIQSAIIARCGAFCLTVDQHDFGPVGTNTLPSLETFRGYDVIMIGTNYFNTHMTTLGDRLADYMDAAGSVGGGVVVAQFALDNNFGCQAGICGRYEDDEYSPIPRGYSYGPSGTMGTIYVPGHPLLDGVASLGTAAYSATTYSTTPGATRIVDWNNGRVLAAVKENPMVSNGARAVSLNFFPPPEYGATSGDYVQLIVNAIRWASRAPEPTIKSMPITTDPFSKIYKDDDPTTTTLQDTFPVRVEVRDDDDGKLEITGSTELSFQNFEVVSQCSGQYYSTNTWPPGWSSSPNPYGWTCGANSYGQGRSPYILYYFNDPSYGTGQGHSYLNLPAMDLSAFVGLQVAFYHNWQANYPSGGQEGFIEASFDGGATFPVVIKSYQHNNPAIDKGDRMVENLAVGGQSSVIIRFRYESNDDWWWAVDNIRFTGVQGSVISGLGWTDGTATVANVPPTAIGGFDSALRNEAESLLFGGFEISDPAILEPTEWFAYAWDFDDGTAVDWNYIGSLAPPKFDILIVHTACLGLIGGTCNAGGSGELTKLLNILNSLDDVGTVDTWNFINYPALPTAPPLSTMLQYDVIIVATNWAYFSYAPFDLARRQVGDRLADYVDSGRGGVITMMCVYCTSGGSDLFSIRGRYMDQDYGPHERANYLFGAPASIEILVPDHDFFVKVGPSVGSSFIYDALLPLTPGGRLLAKFDTGTTAVSDKVHANGARIGHFGGWHAPPGADAPMLLRNMIGYVGGGIPSPKISPFTHTYGDNGIYTVDFMVIDDDMGFVWDAAANMPVEALPGASLAHRYVSVAVNNVEPVIASDGDGGSGIGAFIAAKVCLRVSGTAGNTVTLGVWTDGVLSSSVSTTRINGDPNPPTEKCGMVRVDVMAPHSYAIELTYANPAGGSNPTWLIFSPWREPVTPGHGTITIKYDFDAAGTITESLPNLKRDLLAGGDGAKIDLSAEASDMGTDDLAFVWQASLGSLPKDCNSCEVVVHVHHNSGTATTTSSLDVPELLGFSEPYFDRAANSVRSPAGTMDFRVRDTVVLSFTPGIYYVTLIVLDDDNTRGYPSLQNFGRDGVDIEFVVLDLR